MEERRREGEPEEGVRGGAAAAYVPGAYAQPVDRDIALKDRVRWASVWAGLVVAFASQIWLTAIGVAILADTLAGAPETAGNTLAIWTGIAGLIALFIGGVVASRLAGVIGTVNGIWNGVVLWALSFTLLTILASIGAGGALGSFYGAPGAGGAGTPGTAGATALAGTIATGAWLFVVFQFLSLLAAAAGGAAGARREHEVDTART